MNAQPPADLKRFIELELAKIEPQWTAEGKGSYWWGVKIGLETVLAKLCEMDGTVMVNAPQPERRQYDPHGSLSEYGIFPECDAAPAAQTPRACTCHPDDRPDGPCRERYAAMLRAENERLRAEVDCANGWNERVSVCRDHVTDIVDGPCVICTLNAVEAHADRMWAEADRLAKEVIRVQQKYDERTACVIVHRGSALACSDAVRDAYLDERRRAYRLAELLDQAYGYVPAGTLADQIHCALKRC